MGFSFLALNRETSKKVRFFFSLDDFQSGIEGETRDKFESRYLDLGEKTGDWYESTEAATQVIYDNLCQSARIIFSENGVPALESRNVEILVGHICYHLSQRISRGQSQLSLIDNSFVLAGEVSKAPTVEALAIPSTTAEAMSLLMSDEFGRLVDYSLAQLHFGLGVQLKLQLSAKISGAEEKSLSRFESLKRSSYLVSQKILAKLSRNSSIAIVSPYLGRFGFVFLNLILGQMPAFVEIRKPIQPPDRKLVRALDFTGASSIRDLAMLLLRILVPISVLERYVESAEEGKNLGLPLKPRVIFTSNAFFYDDLFKVYVNNYLSSCTYVVAQHGNNYGVAKFSDLYPEFRAPDLFLSWGWANGSSQVIPFGQIKPKVRAKQQEKVQGVCLVVRDEMRSFLYADMAGPNEKYSESLMNLCDELERLCIRTSIRLHTSTTSDQKVAWDKHVAGMTYVKVSQENLPIEKVIQSGLGIVFTYDSTGMLELGSADIPFFFFAPEGLSMVKDKFQSNYRVLTESGLLSSEPAIAAKLIFEWINASPKEQIRNKNAVRDFLGGISSYPDKKLFALRRILLDSAKAAQKKRSLADGSK